MDDKTPVTPNNETATDAQLLEAILSHLDTCQIESLYPHFPQGTPLGRAFRLWLDRARKADPVNKEALKEKILEELQSSSAFSTYFFQELGRFMERAGMTDSQLYNKIGMSQPLWSNMMSKGLADEGSGRRNAHTNRNNVLKMSVVLRLDYWELYNLMCYGGCAFSPARDKRDYVIACCVRAGIYNPHAIDELLDAAGQEALFGKR